MLIIVSCTTGIVVSLTTVVNMLAAKAFGAYSNIKRTPNKINFFKRKPPKISECESTVVTCIK